MNSVNPMLALQPGLRENCRLGPREQFNEISSIIDAGTVYSNEPEKLEELRLFKNGMLKTLPAFADVRLRDLLPLKIEGADEGCIR
jgi:Animal haem peroxidase